MVGIYPRLSKIPFLWWIPKELKIPSLWWVPDTTKSSFSMVGTQGCQRFLLCDGYPTLPKVLSLWWVYTQGCQRVLCGEYPGYSICSIRFHLCRGPKVPKAVVCSWRKLKVIKGFVSVVKTRNCQRFFLHGEAQCYEKCSHYSGNSVPSKINYSWCKPKAIKRTVSMVGI